MNAVANKFSMLDSDVSRVVVGLGATGISTMRYLKKQGCDFSGYDQRRPDDNAAFWQDVEELVKPDRLVFDAEGLAALGEADIVYLSPGIAPDADWISANISPQAKISGDLDLFSRASKAPVIAITGSNGKSTVVTLVGKMAEACGVNVAVGGNLGTPMLDLLDEAVELYVLELSSFQLERSGDVDGYGLRDHVACILNLSDDHLDRHGSMFAYHAQKQRIYRGAKYAVYCRDDRLTAPLSRADVREASFGFSRPVGPDQLGFEQEEGALLAKCGSEILFDATKVALLGKHNLLNALAAFAIGDAIGLPRDKMREALYAFKGLAHRSELVATINGVRFVNDSKATNVGAAIAALDGLSESVKGGVTLIAGGVGKGADFSSLIDVCRNNNVRLIVLGEAADELVALAGQSSQSSGELVCHRVETLVQAVDLAYQNAQKDDVVLLAPACASFDMFDNFQHRGDCFKQAVEAVAEAQEVASE